MMSVNFALLNRVTFWIVDTGEDDLRDAVSIVLRRLT